MLTRGRVLRAGIVEFCRHGYIGARIDQIAKRAGCNMRMIYHYFGAAARGDQRAARARAPRRRVRARHRSAAALRQHPFAWLRARGEPLHAVDHFNRDITDPAWLGARRRHVQQMVLTYLCSRDVDPRAASFPKAALA